MDNITEKVDLLAKRKDRDLTQMQLAKKIGCTMQHYSRIERGEVSPSIKLAVKIAEELNFDWTAFFEIEK